MSALELALFWPQLPDGPEGDEDCEVLDSTRVLMHAKLLGHLSGLPNPNVRFGVCICHDLSNECSL